MPSQADLRRRSALRPGQRRGAASSESQRSRSTRSRRRVAGLAQRDSPAARALQNALRRAADAQTTLQASAEAYRYDTDGSDIESDQPYIDSLIAEQGRQVYKIMTPFSQQEFERLWHIVGPSITGPWVRGKGPKNKTTAKDAFFMAMNVLHLPTKWDKHGLDFHMKGPTCEKQIWKMIQIAAPICKREFQVNPSMEELREKGLRFQNYPYAHHATDVHFIHGNRPNLPHDEAKGWYSYKHSLYGQKVEASVIPGTGAACNWTAVVAAGEHDKTMMEMNLAYHKRSTKKTAAEIAIPDHGEQAEKHPNLWAILLDKAYVGIEDDVRAIVPEKKLPGRQIRAAGVQRNFNIAQDRVLPENFFGRGAKMWGILAKKYTWSRERLSTIVDFCFALTNYHILFHPLREKDGDYYKMLLADLKRRAKAAKEAGAERQKRYRENKARRDLALANLDDSDASDGDCDISIGGGGGGGGGGGNSGGFGGRLQFGRPSTSPGGSGSSRGGRGSIAAGIDSGGEDWDEQGEYDEDGYRYDQLDADDDVGDGGCATDGDGDGPGGDGDGTLPGMRVLLEAVSARSERRLKRKVIAGSDDEDECKEEVAAEEGGGEYDSSADREGAWGRYSQMEHDFRGGGGGSDDDGEHEWDGSLGGDEVAEAEAENPRRKRRRRTAD